MTATLESVLADIATLAKVTGIKESYDFMPAQFAPMVPCVVVEPDDGDFIGYSPSMHSEVVDYAVKVTVYVQFGDKASQVQLFSFLRPSGATSIRAAIAGQGVGIGVSYAVLSASKPRLVDGGSDTKYLTAEISVRVTA